MSNLIQRHIDLYSLWVDAEKSIHGMLSVDSHCARIADKIEITEKEVTLRSQESLKVLREFLKALNKAVHLIDEGMPKLEELIRYVENEPAQTHNLPSLKRRQESMTEFREICHELENILEPINNSDFTPLLEPRLLQLLQKINSYFEGKTSPPVGVIVTLTYDA